FFSSRRRHTRFSRDWSSDVCSSDLSGAAGTAGARSGIRQFLQGDAQFPALFFRHAVDEQDAVQMVDLVLDAAGEQVLRVDLDRQIGRASCREGAVIVVDGAESKY